MRRRGGHESSKACVTCEQDVVWFEIPVHHGEGLPVVDVPGGE